MKLIMIEALMRIILTAMLPVWIALLLLGIPAAAVVTIVFQTIMNAIFSS